MIRQLLSLLGFAAWSITCGQAFTVVVQDDLWSRRKEIDPATTDLYNLLNVKRYVGRFKMPDKKKHDVLLVMRSVSKDSLAHIDTLENTAPWREKVVGGFPWDPTTGAIFMGQSIDSLHYLVRVSMGTRTGRTLTLPWPNNGYELHDGLGYSKKPFSFEYGKPFPIMVLTQPYPDPPAPAKPIFYRYCFGTIPPVAPDKWPEVFGVPHLYIFEMTVLP